MTCMPDEPVREAAAYGEGQASVGELGRIPERRLKWN
jgi:hypothetical protein